jgi:hypothetical protein
MTTPRLPAHMDVHAQQLHKAGIERLLLTLYADALDELALELQQLEAGPLYRATRAPCLGLALAAGTALWAGLGGALVLLLT